MKNSASFLKTIQARYPLLSKKQMIIADLVLKNPKYIATHVAKDVGEETGTSETTVIRFCYEIGLSGYAALQKEVTLYLFEENTSISSLGNYLSSKSDVLEDEELVRKTMLKDIQRIDKISTTIHGVDFDRASKKMHQASHIYITGGGASKIAADWLAFTLNILRANVSVLPGEPAQLIRIFQEIEADALLIVISQHRYVKQPIQIAKHLFEKGIDVIGITDSEVGPLHDYASISFTLAQLETSTLDLMPALTAFLNALVTGMVSHAPSEYMAQRVNFDDTHPDFIEENWS